MEKKKINKKNFLLKTFEAVQIENLKLQHCLKKIILTRKSLEDHLDSVEKQLSSLAEEESQFETINIKHAIKVQTVEDEVNQLEEKHKVLIEDAKNLDVKIKEYKENLAIKINKYTRKAENLCERFLSAVHNETSESELSKILDAIKKLQLNIAEKESDIIEIKKELEEFVFHGILEDPIELAVQMEERQLLMSWIEDQHLEATQHLQDLNFLKSKKQMEEMKWAPKG